MRSAWIYPGTVPDKAKCAAHDITTILLDPRDGAAQSTIAKIHADGLIAGLYFDPSWYGYPSPLATARIASGHLKRLGLNASWQPVMFDLETKDVAWVRKFLLAWRVLRPTRSTAYTNAPFQGGYVPSLALKLARVDVYVQLYEGDPPVGIDPAAALLEIARQGTPASRLYPFYDGASLPSTARDGCVFTLERIP